MTDAPMASTQQNPVAEETNPAPTSDELHVTDSETGGHTVRAKAHKLLWTHIEALNDLIAEEPETYREGLINQLAWFVAIAANDAGVDVSSYFDQGQTKQRVYKSTTYTDADGNRTRTTEVITSENEADKEQKTSVKDKKTPRKNKNKPKPKPNTDASKADQDPPSTPAKQPIGFNPPTTPLSANYNADAVKQAYISIDKKLTATNYVKWKPSESHKWESIGYTTENIVSMSEMINTYVIGPTAVNEIQALLKEISKTKSMTGFAPNSGEAAMKFVERSNAPMQLCSFVQSYADFTRRNDALSGSSTSPRVLEVLTRHDSMVLASTYARVCAELTEGGAEHNPETLEHVQGLLEGTYAIRADGSEDRRGQTRPPSLAIKYLALAANGGTWPSNNWKQATDHIKNKIDSAKVWGMLYSVLGGGSAVLIPKKFERLIRTEGLDKWQRFLRSFLQQVPDAHRLSLRLWDHIVQPLTEGRMPEPPRYLTYDHMPLIDRVGDPVAEEDSRVKDLADDNDVAIADEKAPSDAGDPMDTST